MWRKVVRLLLEADAPTDAKDGHGRTPLEIARGFGEERGGIAQLLSDAAKTQKKKNKKNKKGRKKKKKVQSTPAGEKLTAKGKTAREALPSKDEL